MVWMEESKGEEQTSSWAQNHNNMSSNDAGLVNKEEMEIGALSTFKSMLEAENEDWYITNSATAGSHQAAAAMHHDISFSPSFTEAADNNQLLLQQVDSSSSCSPTSASVFNNLDPSQHHQVTYFLQPKSLINAIPNNPLEGSFDLGCESGYLESALNRAGGILSCGFNDLGANAQIGTLNLSSNNARFATNSLLQLPQRGVGFGGTFGFGEGSMQGNSLFFNRSKILKPLDNFASIGAQPTLFQKRAALRKNLGSNIGSNLGSLNLGGETNQISLQSPISGATNVEGYDKNKGELSEENYERKRKTSSGEDVEDLSIDGSNLNYDSDDQFLENSAVNKVELESARDGGSSSHANSTVAAGGDQKGKKKGLPAKNLMAERRRRKKLNDRLYMLRSVVPKISKV